jgi:hypothetical protein
MRVLLLSTYEMGRQPFGLASPAAWLREAGCEVQVLDLSRQRLDAEAVGAADLIACHLPMHTATRLLPPVLAQARAWNPRAHLCAYGLYAPLNAPHLRESGIQTILGPECEADLVALAQRLALADGDEDAGFAQSASIGGPLPRLAFRVPDRRGLPPLERYAHLHVAGERRVAGYTEATRGCKHLCRHCPIVPVYGGRFRAVPVDVVLADVAQQVAQGARHITFGDPDFFNGPAHARAIVQRLAEAHPGLTYDVTIKVQHLLAQRELLSVLRDTGCLFVTSAVESVDDAVLERLAKRHTRADFVAAAAACREQGLTLVPTFVTFTPWTTLDGYWDLLQTVRALDLVSHVPAVQWTIRLLIPEGSRLLELDDVQALVEPFDRARLVHPWTHADPRVDELQRRVAALVGRSLRRDRGELFAQIEQLAWRALHAGGDLGDDAGDAAANGAANDVGDGAADGTAGLLHLPPPFVRAAVPYLDEPWYC